MKRSRQPARKAVPHRHPRYNRLSTRAGLIMARAMNYGRFVDAEAMFFEGGVTLAPLECGIQQYAVGTPGSNITVLPTAGLKDIEDGGLAGIVVPGRLEAESTNDLMFEKLVNSARAEGLPVIAFGEGVSRTVGALGYEPSDDLPPGLLFHRGVRILETPDEIREAVAVFREGPAGAIN